MKQSITVSLAVVILASLAASSGAFGQEVRPSSNLDPAGLATAVQRQAAEEFVAANPSAQVLREGGIISRVYGPAFGFGSDPVATAEQFRTRFAGVFGVAAEDLQPVSGLSDGRHSQPLMYDRQTGEYKFTLVYYSQYRDGLPVFRSELRLLVRHLPDYPLVLAVSTLRDIGEFTADPILANLEFDPALQTNTGMTRFQDVRKVIWAGLEGNVAQPVLAVTFIGANDRTDAGYECWRYVCDVATGAILHQETLIHFVDVTGNVKAMATPGAKANICTAEVLFTYPWAKVDILGGSTVYADGNGNFTIPNSGSSAVTVRSYVDGLYFTIDNRAGAEETLTATVTPPGPVSFIHNQANTDDLVLAQTNIYTSGNACRDWLLSYNPSFPGVATETGVPTVVNRTDFYCPCNAWSDGSDGSINFCQAGSRTGCSPCPNTGWQSVLNHEYGHHCIDFTGSGQGEYGEGMSDCFSMLPVDDPNLGYGFCGSCNSGLRTADNDCQYSASGCSSCGSEIHDCGMLLSGIVWDIRNNLVVTEPVNYLSILSDIVVNSILLHTGTAINAQIAIDFLTLDDNDGNINNGTPHRTEICNGFSAHGLSCPAIQVGLSVSPAGNFVASGQAGGPFSPSSINYTVQNLGPTSSITYNVTKSASWLTITNPTGTLSIGQTATVTISLNANANSLPDGDYFDNVQFINQTEHVGDTARTATLRVGVNDLCQYAKRACPGAAYSGSTSGMTTDGATSCGTANTAPDAWYKYTPAASGTAVFALCGSGTTYDAVLSVHSGCPGTSSNTLGCDDDGCGSTGGPSTVTLSVTAGTTYIVRVAGYSGAAGPYSLTITGPDCGSDALQIIFPSGSPGSLLPGVATEFDVQITDRDEVYVPGSGLLHYRYSGGSYLTSALTPLGGNLYRATLPPAACSATPEFYISAQGDGGTTVTNPGNAPTSVLSAVVGTVSTIMDDAFETDLGWSRGDTGDTATTGLWERGDPEATSAQSGDDHTLAPGVNCWVTGRLAGTSDGSYDVDGGKTTLKSPILNLAAYVDATIGYWRWYSNDKGATPGTDTFRVDITNNNGTSWVNAETVGPSGAGTTGGWIYHEFNVADFVTPTALVRLRFVADDAGDGSLVEAALDDVKIISFECEDAPVCATVVGDLDGNGLVDGLDIQGFVNALLGTYHPCADFNGNQQAELGDMDGMVNALLAP